MARKPRGSFNAILYTDRPGEREVVRRVTLVYAIWLVEQHAKSVVGYYGSVVRATDGQNIGLALSTPSGSRRGEFQFA